jgi:hypothetical protein
VKWRCLTGISIVFNNPGLAGDSSLPDAQLWGVLSHIESPSCRPLGGHLGASLRCRSHPVGQSRWLLCCTSNALTGFLMALLGPSTWEPVIRCRFATITVAKDSISRVLTVETRSPRLCVNLQSEFLINKFDLTPHPSCHDPRWSLVSQNADLDSEATTEGLAQHRLTGFFGLDSLKVSLPQFICFGSRNWGHIPDEDQQN